MTNYALSVDDYDLVDQAKDIQARIRKQERLSHLQACDVIMALANFVSVIAERHEKLLKSHVALTDRVEDFESQIRLGESL